MKPLDTFSICSRNVGFTNFERYSAIVLRKYEYLMVSVSIDGMVFGLLVMGESNSLVRLGCGLLSSFFGISSSLLFSKPDSLTLKQYGIE